MIRVLVQLSEEQWLDAREQAGLEGLSFAAYVRQAVDSRLAHAESARLSVRQRALAAIDGLELSESGRGHPEPDRGNQSRADSHSGSPEASTTNGNDGDQAVPRYWLDG